jgi:hypothetical protein
VLKNSLTGPTLLEMSGKATTQARGLRQSRFRTLGLLTLITSGFLMTSQQSREARTTSVQTVSFDNFQGRPLM